MSHNKDALTAPRSGLASWRIGLPRIRTMAANASLPSQTAPHMPVALDPAGRLMEACRLLRGNLALNTPAERSLAMLAPSATPACALVAAGLAAATAEEGQRTLLVDADLRTPLLHTLFSAPNERGFADMLAAGTSDTPIPISETLALVPAGIANFSPAVIFRRQRAADVIQALAAQYDAVIYHIAGTWTTPELLSLTPLVGAAVFTLRAGIETAEHVRRIQQPLGRAGVRFLGFALVEGKS